MCVQIIIFGINHWDPLGRDKIILKLNELKNKGFTPDCIAVEWDKKQVEKIIGQRKWFINYAKMKAPFLYEDTLDTLANTLAYEADSHIDLFPDLPMIWLDEGRMYEGNYAADRLNNRYMYFINKLRNKDRNNIQKISKIMWRDGYSGEAENRDIVFYNKITSAINAGYKNILTIVGASHANIDIEGSFANLLVTEGFNVQIVILNSALSM